MTDGGEAIIASLRRSLRQLVVATLVLGLVIVGLAVYAVSVVDQLQDASCALRADLEARIDQAEQFLAEHPGGTPDIPASAIEQGIRTQQATVDALSTLSCD